MYLPDVKLFRNPQLLQGGEHSTVPVVLFLIVFLFINLSFITLLRSRAVFAHGEE